ncbi:hypothetical protein GN956_G2904 [Arapaima gigas]
MDRRTVKRRRARNGHVSSGAHARAAEHMLALYHTCSLHCERGHVCGGEGPALLAPVLLGETRIPTQ